MGAIKFAKLLSEKGIEGVKCLLLEWDKGAERWGRNPQVTAPVNSSRWEHEWSPSAACPSDPASAASQMHPHNPTTRNQTLKSLIRSKTCSFSIETHFTLVPTSLVIRTQKMFFLTSVFILCFLASSSTHDSWHTLPTVVGRGRGGESDLRGERVPEEPPAVGGDSLPVQAEPTTHHRPGGEKGKTEGVWDHYLFLWPCWSARRRSLREIFSWFSSAGPDRTKTPSHCQSHIQPLN